MEISFVCLLCFFFFPIMIFCRSKKFIHTIFCAAAGDELLNYEVVNNEYHGLNHLYNKHPRLPICISIFLCLSFYNPPPNLYYFFLQ